MRVKINLIFLAVVLMGILGNFNLAEAAQPSQCTGSVINGVQTGCSHDSDEVILVQCKNIYASTADSDCSSMQKYLNKMRFDCETLESSGSLETSGINCENISKDGFYGSEAAKFASYLEGEKLSSLSSGSAATGGLDFESVAALGLPDPVGGLKSVLTNVLNWMLGILGLIGLIAFIVSGGQYLLSFGDDKGIQTAKKNMTYSVIGIIVALSGFIIVKTVDYLLEPEIVAPSSSTIQTNPTNNADDIEGIEESLINRPPM